MWNDSWRNASPRVRGGQLAIVSQVSAAHIVSPHSMGPFSRPMSFGRGASGGGWLVAKVCVRASPITIGAQIDTQRRPRWRSQGAWASLKYSCARC
jgi:hypothetical protein